MFKITIYRKGRAKVRRFKTLDEARQTAAAIFKATGIIVGIEKAIITAAVVLTMFVATHAHAQYGPPIGGWQMNPDINKPLSFPTLERPTGIWDTPPNSVIHNYSSPFPRDYDSRPSTIPQPPPAYHIPVNPGLAGPDCGGFSWCR